MRQKARTSRAPSSTHVPRIRRNARRSSSSTDEPDFEMTDRVRHSPAPPERPRVAKTGYSQGCAAPAPCLAPLPPRGQGARQGALRSILRPQPPLVAASDESGVDLHIFPEIECPNSHQDQDSTQRHRNPARRRVSHWCQDIRRADGRGASTPTSRSADVELHPRPGAEGGSGLRWAFYGGALGLLLGVAIAVLEPIVKRPRRST